MKYSGLVLERFSAATALPRAWRQEPVATRAYGALKGSVRAADAFSRVHGRFRLDRRQNGSKVLVCMLAGYKPDLWPFVMPRFREALPEVDVCLVSPGLYSNQLAELCRSAGWSYLSTALNDVSLAQNLCYRLHERAEMIVKLDEDMFLLPDTIETLLREYALIKADRVVEPGFLAPMIPLNGYCYRHFLEMFDLLDDYEAIFGKARLATSGLAVQQDPAAARWIWEHSAPLAQTASRLTAMGRRLFFCPIQFSIGLIVFERRFWEEMGYLPVSRRRVLSGKSTLGSDEAYICARAVEMSRPGVVTTAAVAGHFSFGPQYAAVKSMLDEQPMLFRE